MSHTPSNHELTLQRAQLLQVTSGLQAVEPAVQREVSASHAAWPPIAGGLPHTLTPASQSAVRTASASAKALPEPSFLANTRQLTGPAAGIAGLYEDYEQLAKRGWPLIEATTKAILGASPTVAGFERSSSSLYIDAIYDGHFDLSLVGKDLTSAYEQLGGSQRFGSALTQSEVNALANAYSIAAVRLEPHPQGAAKGG